MALVGTVLLLLLAIGIFPASAQLDGSFWWMNTNLIKQAEALRETKDVKAIVISKDSELDEVRVGGNSLVDSDSPDCICVPLNRCHNQPTGRFRIERSMSRDLPCLKSWKIKTISSIQN
uniref:Uncharacterized protein n=1 Tax=Anopheles culicifacies TaxID=139723 RepID=A0A182M0I9_9DIPT